MPVASLAARLPDIETVRRWSQSIAVLDAILSPDRSYRYFTFSAHSSEADQVASMQNGSGDEYSIVFITDGACLRGFDHESEMSPFSQKPPAVWPGVIDQIPAEFQRPIVEASRDGGVPAVTVCVWRMAGDKKWSHGPVELPTSEGDPDGADGLFAELDGQPETYRSYALDYFEQEIELSPILHVYEHKPLTQEVLSTLNPDLSLSDVADDLREIDYPMRDRTDGAIRV